MHNISSNTSPILFPPCEACMQWSSSNYMASVIRKVVLWTDLLLDLPILSPFTFYTILTLTLAACLISRKTALCTTVLMA